MTMVSATSLILSTCIVAALRIEKSSAFLPPAQHVHIRRINGGSQYVANLEENRDDGPNLDSIMSSLPSPEAVKDNILEVRFVGKDLHVYFS